MASGWGLVSRKTKSELEGWNFLPYPHPLGGGEGLESEVNDWSCLVFTCNLYNILSCIINWYMSVFSQFCELF